VVVKGDWLPVRLFGFGYILCAMARSLYLALWLLLSQHKQTYDVLIVDQLSASLPLLRLLPKTKVTRLLTFSRTQSHARDSINRFSFTVISLTNSSPRDSLYSRAYTDCPLTHWKSKQRVCLRSFAIVLWMLIAHYVRNGGQDPCEFSIHAKDIQNLFSIHITRPCGSISKCQC
jgi:hypothetical protein